MKNLHLGYKKFTKNSYFDIKILAPGYKSYNIVTKIKKIYDKKDCVLLSMQSYTISATADNYEEVRSMLKAQSGGKIISPGNRRQLP